MSEYAAPLADAAIATFEQLAYCFAEPLAHDAPSAGEVDGVVAVAFRGPAEGIVVLQLSGGVLASVAGNMLGDEERPAADVQQDALGEVANVICGNVLPRIAGSSAVFSLEAPRRFASWSEALAPGASPAAHVAFDLEGGRADLALVLTPGSA